MLSTSSVGFTFDDDDWIPPHPPRLYRTASVGSWGVTSIGRGFDWDKKSEQRLAIAHEEEKENNEPSTDPEPAVPHGRKHHHSFQDKSPVINLVMTSSPQSMPQSSCRPPTPSVPPLSRSPSSPRPRRRSSQQRVSLIAGRVSIAPIEPPSPPPMLSDNLRRTPSSASILSNTSTRAPSPSSENQSFLGGRNISEYLIEGEIGRGAYGLVKRAREISSDGSLGVSKKIAASFAYFTLCLSVAPFGYQTGHQVADPCRLLEKTSKTWHDSYRNLRYVCHL